MIFKKMKWNSILLSLLYVVLGIVLMMYPETTAKTICYIGGGTMIVIGVITLITYLVTEIHTRYYRNDFVIGLLEVLLGLFAIYESKLLIALIPFILGVFVIVSGFSKLQSGLDMQKMKYSRWYLFIIVGIINVVFGVVLLWNPFEAATMLFMVIGAGLIFSGITDLFTTVFISSRLSSFMKAVEKELPVDVEAHEEDETGEESEDDELGETYPDDEDE